MSSREHEQQGRRALALRYEREAHTAPQVVAKGSGLLAERILELAREHEIPVREDADLLKLLSLSEVGDEIPTEVYGAVAEILAVLYGLNGELGTQSL
jgi:flagellar biosynthesis protein